ncbi:hypothetical protein HMPREF1147_1214 [Selenomonas sp. FOBRC9]|nr:hypothetical protein HMPREF1147_1214 [Selenomonas sp. FOBRC9]
MTTNNVRYVMLPYIDTGRITSCRTQRAGEISVVSIVITKINCAI